MQPRWNMIDPDKPVRLACGNAARIVARDVNTLGGTAAYHVLVTYIQDGQPYEEPRNFLPDGTSLGHVGAPDEDEFRLVNV